MRLLVKEEIQKANDLTTRNAFLLKPIKLQNTTKLSSKAFIFLVLCEAQINSFLEFRVFVVTTYSFPFLKWFVLPFLLFWPRRHRISII